MAHCDSGSGFCPAKSNVIDFKIQGYRNVMKSTLPKQISIIYNTAGTPFLNPTFLKPDDLLTFSKMTGSVSIDKTEASSTGVTMTIKFTLSRNLEIDGPVASRRVVEIDLPSNLITTAATPVVKHAGNTWTAGPDYALGSATTFGESNYNRITLELRSATAANRVCVNDLAGGNNDDCPAGSEYTFTVEGLTLTKFPSNGLFAE
jgi:hypothetical protein